MVRPFKRSSCGRDTTSERTATRALSLAHSLSLSLSLAKTNTYIRECSSNEAIGGGLVIDLERPEKLKVLDQRDQREATKDIGQDLYSSQATQHGEKECSSTRTQEYTATSSSTYIRNTIVLNDLLNLVNVPRALTRCVLPLDIQLGLAHHHVVERNLATNTTRVAVEIQLGDGGVLCCQGFGDAKNLWYHQPAIINIAPTDRSINQLIARKKERRKEGTTYALSVDTTLAQLQRAQRRVVEQRLSERNRALVRDVVVVQNQRLERVAVVLGGRLVLQADRQAGDRW